MFVWPFKYVQLLSWYLTLNSCKLWLCELLYYQNHSNIPCSHLNQTLMYITAACCWWVRGMHKSCINCSVSILMKNTCIARVSCNWGVRLTIVGVEISTCYIIWVCVCSLSFPAAQLIFSLLLYILVCGLFGSNIIFVHYFIKHRISEKIFWIQNECFEILYKFCLKHFLFWDQIRFSYQLFAFFSEFNHTWTCRQIFEKSSNINFFWKFVRLEPSSSNRTDGL